MKKLNYRTLSEIGYQGYIGEEAPERVLQFGEGNFMRAFVDDFIDQMNEKADFCAKAVLVAPIPPMPGNVDMKQILNEQEGLYTLYLRGRENEKTVERKRIISCVSRCLNAYTDFEEVMACADNPDLRFIICNTTEAGIVYDESCRFADRPASSYPGKLTQFLYRRFQKYRNEAGKGFLILACELIDDNGKELERCVLQYAGQWELGADFAEWLEKENIFCSTLVDRIVTGFPQGAAPKYNQENGYEDKAMDTGELFGFWVIEGPDSIRDEFPYEKAGLPILVTNDHKPYKQRKVRILNGAHTAMVLGAHLAGKNIVRECMEDEVIFGFFKQAVYKEIIPTLSLPNAELVSFAAAVEERFCNPYIDHALLSISLNSTAKWRARILPSIKEYQKRRHGELPPCLSASLAFYVAFYRRACNKEGGWFSAKAGGGEYRIADDEKVLKFFEEHGKDDARMLVSEVCARGDFWGEDLTLLQGMEERVYEYLAVIEEEGAYELMKRIRKEYLAVGCSGEFAEAELE